MNHGKGSYTGLGSQSFANVFLLSVISMETRLAAFKMFNSDLDFRNLSLPGEVTSTKQFVDGTLVTGKGS